MKKIHMVFITFLFFSFFCLADSASQSTGKTAIDSSIKTRLAIDSITIYGRQIDLNQAYVQARIRNYIKRQLAKNTETDTTTIKITILATRPTITPN